MYFRCLDLYFRCLGLYFSCLDLFWVVWTCTLGVWTCILVLWPHELGSGERGPGPAGDHAGPPGTRARRCNRARRWTQARWCTQAFRTEFIRCHCIRSSRCPVHAGRSKIKKNVPELIRCNYWIRSSLSGRDLSLSGSIQSLSLPSKRLQTSLEIVGCMAGKRGRNQAEKQ